MEVIRNEYLEKLKSLKDVHYIKILTGVRRCGKSTLLSQYKDILIREFGINDNQVIDYDFNDKLIADKFNWKKLTKEIENNAVQNKVNYVFLDEIQEIKNFENCVITLFENKKIKFDIVLTGSNSKMFSDELGSLFTGRYLEIHVFPFSFHEYFEYFKINDISFASVNDMFEQYIQYGGLPILLSKWNNEIIIKDQLTKILDDVINKDIKNRHNLKKNVSEFKRITNYIFDNIGKQTSANKIANYLQSNNKSTTTDKTVDRYIKWMIDANLIYRSDYFNLKGKKVLETSGRYFSIDVGIRNISAKFNLDRGYSLENLVFCEFKRLGCNLYGYKFHDGREIDFIVESKNGKLRKFIQVTEKITSSNQNAEIGNLLLCKEPYERIVISRYDKSDYTVEGVRIVNMINWLLGKEKIDV